MQEDNSSSCLFNFKGEVTSTVNKRFKYQDQKAVACFSDVRKEYICPTRFTILVIEGITTLSCLIKALPAGNVGQAVLYVVRHH